MTNTADPASTERTFDLGPGGEVEITLPGNDVRVQGVNGERVTVRALGNLAIDEELAIEHTPGKLRIVSGDHGYRLGPIRMWTHAPSALEIEVPRDARLALRTISGDVSARGIAGGSRWASASGDLRLDLAGGPVSAESMSGDVTLDLSAPTSVAARAVSGDVRVRGSLIDNLAASTTSGDIRVEAGLAAHGEHRISSVSGDAELVTPSPVRVAAETVTGDVRASGRHTQEGRRGHRTLVSGLGSVRVSIRTTSGDIRMRSVAGPASATSSASAPGTSSGSDEPVAAPRPERAAGELTADPAPRPASPTFIAEAEAAPNLVRDVAAAGDADRVARREGARLEILKALERGELDVESAARRLEGLDGDGEIDG